MDNHHVSISRSLISCGVIELSNFHGTLGQVLFALASNLYHPSRGHPAVFVIWSDVEESFGEQLSIEIHNVFGQRPLESNSAENPLTGNYIAVYVWQIPHEKFKDWYKKERIRRIEKQG